MAAPKQTDPQMKIRLTPELKALIERAADENNRSQNAEILARLQATFDAQSHDLDRIIKDPLTISPDEREALLKLHLPPEQLAGMRGLVRAIVAEELQRGHSKKGKP